MIKFDREKLTKNLSAFLQYQRKMGYGFYQTDITRETGIPQYQLSNYEHGKSIPSLPAIIALADMFDVSIDYLVGRCGNREAHKTQRQIKYKEDVE